MKRILLILFSIFSIFSATRAQLNIAVQNYINTYKELAIAEEVRTGVPAAITLAQGIFESDAGRSKLSLSSNNHFGIKCKNDWTGATVHHDDDARGECFRSYATVEDSYRDHSDFLRTRSNYASLFEIDPTDFEAWAYGLKAAGYATNPVYPRMLLNVINENSLQNYTFIALSRIKNGTGSNALLTSVNDNAQPGAIRPALQTTSISNTRNAGYPLGLFAINQTKVLYLSSGTSLFAIANNYNISYARLLEFNNLNKIDILPGSRLIYLEKKPKRSYTKEYHIVEAGETVELIAQIEGVQSENIFEYNKMQKGLEPATGEKVYLRPGSLSYYPKLVKNSSSRR